jgi:hypothetical protein
MIITGSLTGIGFREVRRAARFSGTFSGTCSGTCSGTGEGGLFLAFMSAEMDVPGASSSTEMTSRDFLLSRPVRAASISRLSSAEIVGSERKSYSASVSDICEIPRLIWPSESSRGVGEEERFFGRGSWRTSPSSVSEEGSGWEERVRILGGVGGCSARGLALSRLQIMVTNQCAL